jgi:hypothetical protein
VAWQLWSHKVLRLLVPYFLILAFLSNAFLVQLPFYLGTLAVQVLFYGLAAYEALRLRSNAQGRSIGSLPYMFCLLNFSAAAGLLSYLRGKPKAAWDKAYS